MPLRPHRERLYATKQPSKTMPYRVYFNGLTVSLKTRDEALRVKRFIEKIIGKKQ